MPTYPTPEPEPAHFLLYTGESIRGIFSKFTSAETLADDEGWDDRDSTRIEQWRGDTQERTFEHKGPKRGWEES